MIFAAWNPPADIFYCGNQWVIKIELAGISPDELEIVTQRNVLWVRGRRKDRFLQKGFSCHSMEISYSSFERKVALPATIDNDSIHWDYQQGILQIQLETKVY